MRSILWAHFSRVFRAGDHVLDLGCGTGQDAIFLTQRGMRVTAIDASAEMVARARERIVQAGVSRQVECLELAIDDISSLAPRTFDGMISSFAALNTIPDLSQLAADASRLLWPGGLMIVHMLNRTSLWELFGLLARRDWSGARHLGYCRERVFTIGGVEVIHAMRRANETYRTSFSPYFELRAAYGLGILRPPSTIRRIPPTAAAVFGRVDSLLGSHRPFLNWGRFFVLDMVVRGDELRSNE